MNGAVKARPEVELVEVCEENREQLLAVAELVQWGIPPVVAALLKKLEGSGEARLMYLTREECALIEAAQRLLG